MYKDIFGFLVTPYMQRLMSINGCYAAIMKAEKKKEGSGKGLPLGVPIPVIMVDHLKERPESWIGGAGSYVCPVSPDWGLWFNFMMNDLERTAVLVSVKGMNPLTGQRVGGYQLEDYVSECPIHKVPFSKDRLCPECNFKWPAQNYIGAPNPLYVDGYRSPDQTVRQFYFTEEMSKSIPELVIGKEDTVPAFGFCFYKSPVVKCEDGRRLKGTLEYGSNNTGITPLCTYRSSIRTKGGSFGVLRSYKSYPTIGEDSEVYTASSDPESTTSFMGPRGASASESLTNCSSTSGPVMYNSSLDAGTLDSLKESLSRDTKAYFSSSSIAPDSLGSVRCRSSLPPIEIGVGAGEKIAQSFAKSHKKAEDYGKDPAGVVRIYFVLQEDFQRYAEAGFNSLMGNPEGYLQDLPVGGAE